MQRETWIHQYVASELCQHALGVAELEALDVKLGNG
jgi:hypothetical protein